MLTLLAVPVACSYFDDAGAWLRRITSAKQPRDKGEKELDVLRGGPPVVPSAAE